MTQTDKSPENTPVLDAGAAVLFCLLAVAQADGPVRAIELDLIARLVDMPNSGDMAALGVCRELLGAQDGLESGLVLVGAALDAARGAQAYALTADCVMLNARIAPEEMRMLDIFAESFRLTPLTRAAIDTAAQIRLAPELGHYD